MIILAQFGLMLASGINLYMAGRAEKLEEIVLYVGSAITLALLGQIRS